MKNKYKILNCLIIFIVFLFLFSPRIMMAQQVPVGKVNRENTDNNKKEPKYWYNKGVLFSVYGNYPSAIECFKKTIELDPQHQKANFQLGISYGELEDYKKALAAISKAIELAPDNGTYYYGRGRIYLMAGNKEKAWADFRIAADYGSREAIKLLKRHQSKEKESEKKPILLNEITIITPVC